MNSHLKLKKFQENKKSLLCVGLDTDLSKIPSHFPKNTDSLFEFNKSIISAVKEYASAFKINFAFYEKYGAAGFDVIKETIDFINGESFVIADAKRGDIGNTSEAYAQSCFEYFKADSITAAPYMGYDSVAPFLDYKDKLTFVLGLTSNKGSNDFQKLIIDGEPLYKYVIKKCSDWADYQTIGFVAGAVHPNEIAEIRSILKNNFLLIPGVGTQGGDINELLKANGGGLCTINVSRDIIYTDSGFSFAEKAALRAKFYKEELGF